ncbi:MAG TPA: aminopeptidase P N-terminal domain-containing protein [Bacteroidales bacterium]|nr:aminopeptidase P N-terminal domain-containing protein [Bacteroidales bacterium]
MRYQPISPSLFSGNRERLGRLMEADSLAVVHAADIMQRNGDQDYPYRQESDLFYLTGIEQPGTILLLAPHHPSMAAREVLFILDPDPEDEQRNGLRLDKEKAAAISGIRNIQWLSGFEMWLHRSILESSALYLHIYEYPKYVHRTPSPGHRFAEQMQHRYPGHAFRRLAPLLIQLRMLKGDAERQLIQHAIDITAKAFHRVAAFIRPGHHEYEAEAEILHEYLRQGSVGPAYQPIIASGSNACILHYNDNDHVMQDGDLVLLDIGAEYANYAADLSRTLPVNGRFSPKQRKYYDAVHRVLKAMETHFVPGNTIEKINHAARLMMADELIRLGLPGSQDAMNEKEKAKWALSYMVHGITHHIGLDVHDVVDPSAPLAEGMIMTCEPGLYLPAEGIGIRIENDILVGNPPVNLMAHIPSDAAEIEALMAAK